MPGRDISFAMSSADIESAPIFIFLFGAHLQSGAFKLMQSALTYSIDHVLLRGFLPGEVLGLAIMAVNATCRESFCSSRGTRFIAIVQFFGQRGRHKQPAKFCLYCSPLVVFDLSSRKSSFVMTKLRFEQANQCSHGTPVKPCFLLTRQISKDYTAVALDRRVGRFG